MKPATWKRMEAIAERIHKRMHGNQCADIHPVVHASHMAGFRNKARIIIEREKNQ